MFEIVNNYTFVLRILHHTVPRPQQHDDFHQGQEKEEGIGHRT